MRFPLKDGEWIDLRPIQSLKAKDRDAYESVIKVYVSFDSDGKPDMSKIPFSMSLASLQRTALLARLLQRSEGGWSFTYDADDPDVPEELRGQPIPLPRYEDNEVINPESPGEIPLDYWDEIEAILAPYMAKVTRKPDPTGTTSAVSNGTSRERASTSRKA